MIESDIDCITFTGGPNAGHEVAARAGERMLPCTLELGGNNPVLVLKGADLNRAAVGITYSSFANAGRMCAGAGKLFVHQDDESKLLAAIEEQIKAMRPENEYVIGENDSERLRELMEDAVTKGARIVCGGVGDAAHWAPTVLAGVTDEMRIAQEETFGPILPVTTVANEKEMIERAGDTPYGLSAYVYAGSHGRAKDVLAQLKFGTVVINDGPHTVCDSCVPWGGVGASGLGRVHGDSGLLFYTYEKVVSTPRLRLPGGELWELPYTETRTARVEGLTRFRYGEGLLDRLGGLWRFIAG